MTTKHQFFFQSAAHLEDIPSDSIHLVVTSPPYPMIEMWDDSFCNQDKKIKPLITSDPYQAYERMHRLMDGVWQELYRVVKPGGIVCINIGDATRSINKVFALYPNHVRMTSAMLSVGFQNLPNILWRKQTNAPNKFMGSGMLPPGAYATLEHEYILIFRKGEKRSFSEDEKTIRRESAYFWEERNVWFSDLWDIKGAKQKIDQTPTRERSAAFPIELPYRLINMFSVYNDIVLDPFAGIGTTVLASMILGRNSIGVDIDKKLNTVINERIMKSQLPKWSKEVIGNRIKNHLDFISERKKNTSKSPIKYKNTNYEFPVMTKQEREIIFYTVRNITNQNNGIYEVEYES